MTSRNGRSLPFLDRAGLSLLELLLALTLLTLVTAGIYALIGTGATAARDTGATLRTQTQVRAALDGIVDEVRWAARVLSSPLPTATSVVLCVPQSPLSSTPYFVAFAYDGVSRRITRALDPDAAGPSPFGTPEPLAVLPGEGRAPVFEFQYFDKLGTSTPDPSTTARIRIRIRMEVQNRLRVPATERELIGDVALRQFGTPCP